MMGGDIIIDSELGKGSSFSFIIRIQQGDEQQFAQQIESSLGNAPIQADAALKRAIADSGLDSALLDAEATDTLAGMPAALAAGDEITPYKDNFAGKRALLAEDIEVNREIVISLLEPTQLEIEWAVNGQQAVDMFVADPSRYDIIFMDLQMPEMDGFEATRQIRALDVPTAATVPIIAMTANVFREDVDKSLEVGMNGHLGKPLDLDQILETLRHYLLPSEPH
jgi:CheY-like chemotaxis protein